MDIIAIENLQHRFSNGTLGLDQINLNIEAGAFVVVAGPNGSGKTTLIRHLNGLLQPTSGRVFVEGVSVQKDLLRARRLVGMMFQDADSQIVGETVRDDVAFGPENLRLDVDQINARVSAALEAVGLKDYANRRPHMLSGGEKRRLAIAGILAMEPKVIVFDEPFASLDYPGVKQVLKQILALHQGGHTIIVITHDLEKVLAHADRLVIMQNGKIVKDGAPAEILGDIETYGVRAPCASHLGLEVRSWLN
ncbi:MAG: ATP-binding cassette domain-containing protein [Desulfobacterales bacterium]|nr:ATP-binding cassette domain-containing protein [Desulfobacterales bacterium]